MEYTEGMKEGYDNKLKSKLFHLLCEREEGGEWQKFLDSILIELMGFEEEERTINYYILFKKLSARVLTINQEFKLKDKQNLNHIY